MEKLTQILNRIGKARPESEKPLVQEYLKELAQCCSPQDQQILLKKAAHLPDGLGLWANVTSFLESLNITSLHFELVPSYLREDIIETLKNFSKIANRRALEINRISLHIMFPQYERLYFKLSKISLNELRERLQKLWKNFRQKNLPQLHITDELMGIKFSSKDTQSIIKTIKNIHYVITIANQQTNLNDIWATNIPTIFFNVQDKVSPERLTAFRITLDALEAMAYVHHEIQTKPTPLTNIELFPFHDFAHCSKCWRLVPKFLDSDRPNTPDKKYQKSLRTFYCDEHSPIECEGHTLTEYHKAIKLPCNNKKDGVYPATAQKTYELMKHFPSFAPDNFDGLSAQEWYKARVSPISQLDLSRYPRIIFDLNWIWELCPNVLRYIQEKGGDPNLPESVLENLDPFTKREEAEGKEFRIKLHRLLAKNFGLYLQEIAIAETFLSEYYSQWDGRTHGGSRRNSRK